MSDEYERMPGNELIQFKELRKFRNCESFTISDEYGNDKLIKYDDDVLSSYNYYFQIWDNCRRFGLPGGDWTKSPPWLISLIKQFDHVYNDIELYRIDKRKNQR
jgi:hypothetical protein